MLLTWEPTPASPFGTERNVINVPNKSSWMTRQAGILLPVSSLPSPYGFGSFGKAAREWVDFLHAARQSCWQVLPLGPTSFGNSPYQSYSAFAVDPLYMDLDLLCEEGLLSEKRLKKAKWGGEPGRVDYDAVRAAKEPLLRKAYENFKKEKALSRFCKQNAAWVEDYALFMALKDQHGGVPWYQWEEGLRLRQPAAIKAAKKSLAKEAGYYAFTQYLCYKQWEKLKKYANKKGVRMVGDAPIYVSADSADVWAHPELFQLDESNLPTAVAGCPPDAFSEDGQLWGNPLYRWERMEEDGYAWWISRIKANLEMFDVLRIDHFRGFESYWAIPYGDETAKNGKWRKGPGMSFVKAVNQAVPGAAIIAEDLGMLTPAVHRLLKQSGYPGMKVLQFAFSAGEESSYLPHNLERNAVIYTGTHDNDTTRGWLDAASPQDLEKARDYLGFETPEAGVWALIRAAQASVCGLCVIPMQDYLGLGPQARINAPSTVGPHNWSWRMERGACTKELAKKIARLTVITGRAEMEDTHERKRRTGKKAGRKKAERG